MRSKRMELRRLKQLLLCCIDRCRCPQIQDAFLDSSFLIIPTYTHPWFNPKVWTYLWSLRSDVCHWGFCHWVNQRPHTWASVKLKSYQYWFPGPGPNPSGRTRYIPIRIVLVFKQDCRTSDSFYAHLKMGQSSLPSTSQCLFVQFETVAIAILSPFNGDLKSFSCISILLIRIHTTEQGKICLLDRQTADIPCC